MDKPKIYVGVPTRATPDYEFASCLGAMDRYMCGKGYKIRLAAWAPGTLVKKNRNLLVREFLKTDCDLFMTIDDDTLFPPDGVEKLINDDKDIVGGVYIGRKPPIRTTTFRTKKEDGKYKFVDYIEPDALFEVEAMGMGFCLIKRHVLETMQPPWYNEIMDNERLMWGEDIGFCLKAKMQYGFKIWADCRIHYKNLWSLGHVGRYVFSLGDLLAQEDFLKRRQKSEGKK